MNLAPVQITKEQAVKAYGGNKSALARALGITSQAVVHWPDRKPIPENHSLMLQFVLKKDWDWAKGKQKANGT